MGWDKYREMVFENQKKLASFPRKPSSPATTRT